jgi:hypothetical protein
VAYRRQLFHEYLRLYQNMTLEAQGDRTPQGCTMVHEGDQICEKTWCQLYNEVFHFHDTISTPFLNDDTGVRGVIFQPGG